MTPYFFSLTRRKQRWSPRGHILKSLASKPQVLENCPVLGSRTALFLNHWNFVGKRQKPCGKSAKTFFWFPQVEIAWKNVLKTFFFFLENTCVCVFGPWPWPRALCPRLHLWSEVNPALQLIQDFSSHANLQINRKKTTILSNNKHLSDEIKKHLPEAKYPHEAKILGIRFSLIFSTLKQNCSCLTGIIKGIADSHKHRNLSMHIKLLLIKTLLLPHITITARVFQCLRKTQMSISKILNKFLWSPSYFEPISRITLSKIPQHGGIGMPSSSAWINTALLVRLKSLTSNPTSNLFWTSYALYNPSYRIRKSLPGNVF